MKINSFIQYVCTILLGCASLYCAASNQYSVRVTQIGTYQPVTGSAVTAGMAYITVETARTGTLPTCTTQTARWALNSTNPDIAKMQMSQLQLALSQGRPINVYGTGDCNINGLGGFGGFEVINYLEIN